jgi:HlyD family secretion protein
MKTFIFKQQLKWLYISATIAGVSILALVIYGSFIKTNSQSISVTIATVTEGRVENKITGEDGVLKLRDQRQIKSLKPGTVEQILVKVGDIIKKGQVLVRLGNKESQIQLQEIESDLKDKAAQLNDKYFAFQQAKNKLFGSNQDYQKAKINSISNINITEQQKKWEIEKLQLDVIKKTKAISQAEDNLKKARVKLGEDKQLLEKGFISANELKEQENQVSEAETNLSNAKDELYISQIELQKQVLDLQNFIKSVNDNSSEPQKNLKDAQDKVEESQVAARQAKLALEQLIRELEKLKFQRQKVIEELNQTVITSPSNGVILDIKVAVGDVIDQKEDILLIGDPSQQAVELKLSPLDATKVKLGQQAEVSIVGLESEKIMGKVQDISLLAKDEQNNNNQSSSNVKVTVVVGLDKNQNIAPGTPVGVDLIVSRRDKVLVLPNEAIQEGEAETFVWMQGTQGKAIKKIINIGLQGLNNVEIKSGLKLEDKVLVPSLENPLTEGKYVKIKNDSIKAQNAISGY